MVYNVTIIALQMTVYVFLRNYCPNYYNNRPTPTPLKNMSCSATTDTDSVQLNLECNYYWSGDEDKQEKKTISCQGEVTDNVIEILINHKRYIWPLFLCN